MYDLKKAIVNEFPDEIKSNKFSASPTFSSIDSNDSINLSKN